MNPRATSPDAAFNGPARQCWFWAGWEPMRHYRRMGKSGSPFFGKGAWLPAWEDRKFNGQMVGEAKKLGATLLITEFFKGFGRALEAAEWPRLAEFVRHCHAEGMQVWGYAQTRSIYYETFGTEVPDWQTWAARDRDGRMQVFGNTYYRCAPCLTCPDYAAYLLETIGDGVAAIGWDGIHMDNSYYEHCWCGRCADLFLEYLEQRGDFEQRTGIPLSEHVIPPPLPGAGGVGLDPLQILWMEFGVETRLRFFGRLREELQQRHPGLVVAGNPAFPRAERAMLARGVDPSRESRAFDVLCCENGNLPRVENGTVISQAEAHLLAEAGNYGVWVTAWRHTSAGVEPPSAPGGIWTALAEEFAHGSLLGNNWALRPSGRGANFQFEEDPERTAAFGAALAFFRRVEQEVDLRECRTWAELAVLHDPLSASLFGAPETLLNQALQEYLLRTGIPFRIVFPGQPLPAEVRRLAVFHVGAIAEATRQWITNFAARPGCGVWLAGHSGQTDDWFVPRELDDLETFRCAPGIVHTAAFSSCWQQAFLQPAATSGPAHGHFDTAKAGRAGAADPVFEEFFHSEHWKPSLRVHKRGHVLAHCQADKSGRLLLHLRDQSGSNTACEGIAVALDPAAFSANSARWFSPDSPQPSILERHPTTSQFKIPPFHHCGLLELL